MDNCARIQNSDFKRPVTEIHNVPQVNRPVLCLPDFQQPFCAVVSAVSAVLSVQRLQATLISVFPGNRSSASRTERMHRSTGRSSQWAGIKEGFPVIMARTGGMAVHRADSLIR